MKRIDKIMIQLNREMQDDLQLSLATIFYLDGRYELQADLWDWKEYPNNKTKRINGSYETLEEAEAALAEIQEQYKPKGKNKDKEPVILTLLPRESATVIIDDVPEEGESRI